MKINLRSAVFVTLIHVFLSMSSYAKTPPIKRLFKPQEISALEPLNDREGYLLIELDVANTSSSLEFFRLKVNKQRFLKEGQKIKRANKVKKLTFKKGKEGFYFTKLPKGLYQIKRVNAPSFNLPFRMSTEERRQWRFSIVEGKINYIGKLEIEKKRSSRHVEINFLNRFAMSKGKIEALLIENLINYSLELSVGVRDDFFENFNSGKGVIHEK